MMKIQEFLPDEVRINSAISARRGDPKPEDVQRLAENIVQVGQLQPGIVRVDGKVTELVVGRNRLEAIRLINSTLDKTEEPYKFSASVVRAGDDAALVDAITENAFRTEATLFDRADSMQRLADLGKTQAEIARVFGFSEATVSQTLQAGKLPKKLQKMVVDGDLEQDAAIFIGGLDDEKIRQEVIDEVIRYRNKLDEIRIRSEHKETVEQAKAKAGEVTETLIEKKRRASELAKANKEAEKVVKSLEGSEDTEAIAAAVEAAKAAKKELAAAQKEAERAAKAAEKAALEVERAKEAKKAATSKSKVSVQDAKAAAKEKGATRGGKKVAGPTPVTKNKFLVTLEAMISDESKPVPESVTNLVGKIEAFLDGEATATQLLNSFVKWCVPD